MRTIKTTTGTTVELDGDVLAILETISRDLARRLQLEYSFEDVEHEFEHLIGQMNADELRIYLKESLFMSFNRFENERLIQMVRKANRADEDDSPLV